MRLVLTLGASTIMASRIKWADAFRHFGFERLSSLYLAVLAGAYEYHDISLVSDSTFDILSKSTRMPDGVGFDASTGQWVYTAIAQAPALRELISDCVVEFRNTKHKDFQHMEVLPVVKQIYTNYLMGAA